MKKDDIKENLFDYQQFINENKNGNTKKAQSEINNNNNNNNRINDVNNNFKTEIKIFDLDKKKIQFGFENKKADEDEIRAIEEDAKGKIEDQIEDYQMKDENGDLANLINEYYDISTVEVNNSTQKSYKLSENQKSEFSENDSQSKYFDNIMNTE